MNKLNSKYSICEESQLNFLNMLNSVGFDSYGEIWENRLRRLTKVIKGKKENIEIFENDTFLIIPYYWGNDSKLCELPNFVHKESQLILSWYKSPTKGMKCNKEISVEEFVLILDDCKKSLNM